MKFLQNKYLRFAVVTAEPCSWRVKVCNSLGGKLRIFSDRFSCSRISCRTTIGKLKIYIASLFRALHVESEAFLC